MGMDVYGRNPTSPEGEYFRNNVWWWHPLASFCQYVAPEVCSKCTYWHTNDGDGLDAEGAQALADALQATLDGPCAARMERTVQRGKAEGPFSVENVAKFVTFLRSSGGFDIN